MARNTGDFFQGAFATSNPRRSKSKYLLGTGENEVGTQSGANLTITAPDDDYVSPNSYTWANSEEDPEAGQRRFEHHVLDDSERRDFDDSGRQFRETGQLPLFTVKHTPPVLDYMTSTKDATHGAMALAAHAAEETRRRFGERPVASHNTSEHSTPMVNSAIKAGIIRGVEGQPAGESAKVSNNMGWLHGLKDMNEARSEYASLFNSIPEDDFNTTADYYDGMRRTDPKLINADFGTIKEEMRQRHAGNGIKGNPSQFQPTLPGMEMEK